MLGDKRTLGQPRKGDLQRGGKILSKLCNFKTYMAWTKQKVYIRHSTLFIMYNSEVEP